MSKKAEAGGGIVGLIFLALAAFNFFRGENWIVWFILGALFGGIGAASRLIGGRSAQ